MEPSAEAQGYVDEMARARGYVLDYHKIMAANDFEVLKAANNLVSAAYLAPRHLDRRTKELLFTLSLTVAGAPASHIASHIQAALDAGSTPEEILEAIEIALPEVGVVAFQRGLEAWAATVNAPRLEPSPGILPDREKG